MADLQSKGFIPDGISLNQDTYNTFILPRYEWFVSEGLIEDS